MSNKSSRKELVELLKKDNTQRIYKAGANIHDKDEIVYLDDYLLLLEHLNYLNQLIRNASDSERYELIGRMDEVKKYMLEARYGDRNIGRFNGM